MTHKKKDCLERPRKVGARFTGQSIAPDEVLHGDIDLDYDGKRDRWNGYDPAQYKSILEEYRKVEEAKRELKAEKMKQDVISGEGLGEQGRDSDADEDEDKYVDDVDMPGTKVDSKQRITVRNLRIREDTAKYLRNLDPNSAYYDPKTRAMRDNPMKNGQNEEEVQYAGDNFVRYTGDTVKHAQAQMFAWEAYERGVDVHLLAEPTKLELLNKEFDKRKDEFEYTVKDKILDKYGGEEHLQVPPKELLLAQSEDYVEYSRHGKVIKGEERPVIRSKYEEDVYINNHTSVWGSYYVHGWVRGSWGYKCCHSLVKNSYCTGEAGKAANAQAIEPAEDEHSESEEEEVEKTLMEIHKEMRKTVKDDSDSDEEAKKERLNKALEEEDKNQKHADKLLKMDERKRPYNSMYNVKAPTEEEMEAYYMKKRHTDDPMADFL
jgi:pre-mRNA-processing factor SLU7